MAEITAKKVEANKINKGDTYLCEVCGLQVKIDVCCENLAARGLSCGQIMTTTSGAAKKIESG